MIEAVVNTNKQSSGQKEPATDFISQNQLANKLPTLIKDKSSASDNVEDQGHYDLDKISPLQPQSDMKAKVSLNKDPSASFN